MTQLDDDSAIQILKTIAQARLHSGVPDLTPDLRYALADEFDASPKPSSEGDIARAALTLLAEDPEFAEPIQIMSRQGVSTLRKSYSDPVTIALATAAILALQTRVKFKIATGGKWSFEIEKKDGPVKLLIERLLSYLPPMP